MWISRRTTLTVHVQMDFRCVLTIDTSYYVWHRYYGIRYDIYGGFSMHWTTAWMASPNLITHTLPIDNSTSNRPRCHEFYVLAARRRSTLTWGSAKLAKLAKLWIIILPYCTHAKSRVSVSNINRSVIFTYCILKNVMKMSFSQIKRNFVSLVIWCIFIGQKYKFTVSNSSTRTARKSPTFLNAVNYL